MKELEEMVANSLKGIKEGREEILGSLKNLPEEESNIFKGVLQNINLSLEKKDVNLLNNQMEILQNMMKK